ncbi:hypothetical protein BF2512_13 [Dickeya phage BF25/12]|uniref:Uncharacterized protein n=1 Tax=Dickeya phage BF25/12 TaxID=1698708 RepID=A0A219MH70_9CAUD|nr:hypothetical protein HOR10_gp13 [Dickeya phage BF25/12]ALA46470.1 hypothetical protein BF2512_13 [Dickeya phage BF25/12]
MINSILITVQSAVLFVSGALSEPQPFCVVEVSTAERADLYHNPEGGCNALGSAIKADMEKAHPGSPVVLIVDGKSNQSL